MMSPSSAMAQNRIPYSSIDMQKVSSGSWKLEIGCDFYILSL